MDFPKPIVYVVVGFLTVNSVYYIGEVHPIHEAYPNQNITRILVSGTTAPSGGTIFISGDKAVT